MPASALVQRSSFLGLRPSHGARRGGIARAPCAAAAPRTVVRPSAFAVSGPLRGLSGNAQSRGFARAVDLPVQKISARVRDVAMGASKGPVGFVTDNFLPLGLLAGLAAGLAVPQYGQAAHALGLPKYATMGIFLISGLTLRSGDVKTALESWGALLFGFVSILALTPLVAPAVAALPIQPAGLAMGLALFRCMPTTLSSGVALTAQLGGNTALALALTVGTNIAGIFTVPYVLSTLLGGGTGVYLPPEPLLKGLAANILAPLLAGMAVRKVLPPPMARVIIVSKKALGLLSSALLMTVPWSQVSQSASSVKALSPESVAALVAAALGTHMAVSIANRLAAAVLGLGRGLEAVEGRKVQQTVTLLSSGKTLPVAVTVLGLLNGALGDTGLMIVACVLAHVSGIVFDSVLVAFWRRRADIDSGAAVVYNFGG